MNNKRDFFTGAGFDEPNQNYQPMDNGIMNNNQGMMNQQEMMKQQGMQQPMQQPMQSGMQNNMFGGMQQQMINNSQMGQQPMNNGMVNNFQGMMNNNQGMMNQQSMQQQMQPGMQNNMFGGMQQPMMDNSQMMNQQPMNNGMMNQVPVNNFGNQAASKGKIDLNSGLFKVLLTVVILVVILVLVVVLGHKTLSCTQEMDADLYTVEMTAKIEYWFGKATSKTAIMSLNFVNLDDDQKEQLISNIEDLAEETEEDNVKVSIKKNDKSVTLIAKQKITDDEDVGSYDEERKSAIDADYVCK